MELVEVTNSSNIDKIGYEAATQTLRVDFLSGARYEYANVPKTVWEEFVNAESKGRYFGANIAKNYEYQQLHYPSHVS